MNRARFSTAFVVVLIGALLASAVSAGDILVSGNEGKYDLSSGIGRAVENAEPDSLTILDFAVFPPRARHIAGVANSVIGPPTNVAITPDGRLAQWPMRFAAIPMTRSDQCPTTWCKWLTLQTPRPA